MLFKVLKSTFLRLQDLETDILLEASSIGSASPPKIVIHNFDDEHVLVETDAYMRPMLIHDYDAEVHKVTIPSSVVLIDERLSHSNIYSFSEKGIFKTNRKPMKFIPAHVRATIDEQCDALRDGLDTNPCLQGRSFDDAINILLKRVIEQDSKLIWTVEKDKHGNTSYLLQLRTPQLSIILKIASNNFGNMYVKYRFPPSGERLTALHTACDELRKALFGSLMRRDCNGLIDFYEFVRNNF